MRQSDALSHADAKTSTEPKPITSYREVKIGKKLYRVTNVYLGKIDLKTALEDLAVSKALQDIEAQKKFIEAE